MYKVREFAVLAGVSVRTLHHYDRLGLLHPQRRTDAGYRLYGERDLERLEQIVAMKFLGFSLGEIRELLDKKPLRLPAALALQQRLLEQKRQLLDHAIQAIRAAAAATQSGQRPDATSLRRIIEVIAMENQPDWKAKYYSEEARAKIAARQPTWTPELQAEVSQKWAELVRDVEAALSEDTASPKAQALVARWDTLVAGFTQRDPEVTAGVKNLYADRANWPADFQQQMAPFRPELFSFIQQARTAGKRYD